MSRLIGALLIVAAIIHLLPVVGVLGATQLASLYGVAIDPPELVMLMRHRAVLFAIVGGLLVHAVLRPSHRAVAIIAGLVSVVSFLVLASTTQPHDAQIARVVLVDLVALACLVVAGMLHAVQARNATRS